jgi:peptidoglycan/LPS O-acetylase OafA/YrhL
MRLGPGLFLFLCSLVGVLARFGIAHGYYDHGHLGLLGYFAQPTLLAFKLHVFAVGMLMALLVKQGAGVLRSNWFWAAFPLFLLTCQEHYLWLMAAIYWSAFILCRVPRSQEPFLNGVRAFNERLRMVPWRQPLAECSYGTYLIHNIVIVLLITRIWTPTPNVHRSLIQCALAIGLNLALTTLISWSTYKLIEKPGIELGRNLIRRLGPAKRGSAAGAPH